MGRSLYERNHLKVFVSYTPRGKKYYTVVNTRSNVHRHYQYEKQAIMTCKRAGDGIVPRHYSNKAKNDIRYLITGDEQYK